MTIAERASDIFQMKIVCSFINSVKCFLSLQLLLLLVQMDILQLKYHDDVMKNVVFITLQNVTIIDRITC